MKQTIGEKLKHEREARHLTLEQVSAETHIRVHYLKALEENRLDDLPSLFQGRGFIRVYAAFLGLDSEPLIKQLDQPQATVSNEPAPTPQPDADAPADESDAQAIFTEIGNLLANARQQLELSLEDVERQTHLRAHHIQAMERGDFDALPSPVQGRGMLGIYARFLGYNPDTLLLRYADALKARLAQRQTKPAQRRTLKVAASGKINSWSWLWSTEFLLISVIALGLVLFFIWGLSSVLSTRAGAPPTPTAISIAEILLEPITAIPETPTVMIATPSETSAIGLIGNGLALTSGTPVTTTLPTVDPNLVHITISVKQRAWMKILVDGKKQFDGRVIPGSAYEFSGKNQIEIQTGNAGALQILYNQQDLGVMGNVGEVLTRIYTLEGVAAPTPTVTLTPTSTPRPSITPRPTSTQRPTATARPSPTPRPTSTPSG
ncbi:MAG: helix-turn-helix domain-containing protein [Anaerolineales bacterium]